MTRRHRLPSYLFTLSLAVIGAAAGVVIGGNVSSQLERFEVVATFHAFGDDTATLSGALSRAECEAARDRMDRATGSAVSFACRSVR